MRDSSQLKTVDLWSHKHYWQHVSHFRGGHFQTLPLVTLLREARGHSKLRGRGRKIRNGIESWSDGQTSETLTRSVSLSAGWLLVAMQMFICRMSCPLSQTDAPVCVCVSVRRRSIVQFDTKQLKTFCFHEWSHFLSSTHESDIFLVISHQECSYTDL